MDIYFVLSAALFVLFIILIFFIRQNLYLKELLKELSSKKKSLEVKHGKAWEEFVPLLRSFPYTKENFRFLGTPIDGVAFEDDKIVLVEIKTGSSRLSARQKEVKRLIEEGKVEFKELRY